MLNTSICPFKSTSFVALASFTAKDWFIFVAGKDDAELPGDHFASSTNLSRTLLSLNERLRAMPSAPMTFDVGFQKSNLLFHFTNVLFNHVTNRHHAHHLALLEHR